jgi:K+-transporting ATPase ATPase C chain
MRRQLLPALLMTIVLSVLLGLVYPLAVTAVGQVAFSRQANGSIVKVDGTAVGSSLLGQNFTSAKYFQPRPSAAGKDGYDGLASAASYLGPSNQDLLSTVADRATAYRQANGLAADAQVPVDAVTASASGLDPDISIANADIQAHRIAATRHLPMPQVMKLISDNTLGRGLGFSGEPGVDVLDLNLALDKLTGANR